MMIPDDNIAELIGDEENCYTIKRIFDSDNVLSIIQVLNTLGQIYKVLFYENGSRLSNLSVYNPKTGKEIRNITYRADGKTISSVREYDMETESLLSVTFYKPDGLGVSSIIEYNDTGTETQFTLFGEDNEIITQVI